MAKKAPKEFKPGQYIRVKLSGGRIEEARINHVIQSPEGIKLQVDFGHDETALIESLERSLSNRLVSPLTVWMAADSKDSPQCIAVEQITEFWTLIGFGTCVAFQMRVPQNQRTRKG